MVTRLSQNKPIKRIGTRVPEEDEFLKLLDEITVFECRRVRR